MRREDKIGVTAIQQCNGKLVDKGLKQSDNDELRLSNKWFKGSINAGIT